MQRTTHRDPTGLTRREFVATSLAAGFAAAVLPVAADTLITTSAAGLAAGEVKIPTNDVEIPGYRAMPATGSSFPVVVVVHEIFGVHEYIRDVCRRLGSVGYFAVAPSLFARQGDVSTISDMQEIGAKVVSKVPDAQVMSDLDATAAWAAKSGAADASRLGITGFCWGGRIVWMYDAHSPAVKAGVAWYGPLARPATPLTPKDPVDIAKDLHGPVLGLYGAADAGIPLDSIEQMRAALRAAHNPSEIVVYPDAPHGFHADYRPSYRRDAATDGWQRMLRWFERFGLAPNQTKTR